MRIRPAALATGLLGILCLTGSLPAEPNPGLPRRVVLTFDDLPAQRAGALSEDRIRKITTSLVAILQRHGIPAIGFVNEDKLYRDGQPTVASWVEKVAGIEE